jgi:hypothetical protein
MFIDKDSISVNGVNLGQYLLEVQYQYPKLWGEDTGRNLAGTFSGTLLGIFPKFVMQFRKLTQAELEILAPIFDSQSQTITYYDPVKKENVTKTTYTGDWTLVNKGVGQNAGFQISFISTSKRV